MLFTRPDGDLFSSIPMASIDVAVMENFIQSRIDLRMIPLDAGWRDVGTWDSLRMSLPQDEHGNAFKGDVFAQGVSDTISYSSGRWVALLGVEGLIVVETPDAVLVADRHRGEELKAMVEELLASRRPEASTHTTVHRPWGWFETIAKGRAYKLKRLVLRQGAAISLQRHRNRSEHWVVVSGLAEVVCDDKVFQLGRDQSTYIPIGAVHRLTNVGETELDIVEVQTGTELNEDDIERLEDRYGSS